VVRTVNDFTTDEWIRLRVKLLSKILLNHSEENLLTVRELSKKLKVPQEIVIQLAEDQPGLDVIIGVGSFGGSVEFESVGDYEIEFYDVDNSNILDDLPSTGESKQIQFMINHMKIKNYAVMEPTKGIKN